MPPHDQLDHRQPGQGPPACPAPPRPPPATPNPVPACQPPESPARVRNTGSPAPQANAPAPMAQARWRRRGQKPWGQDIASWVQHPDGEGNRSAVVVRLDGRILTPVIGGLLGHMGCHVALQHFGRARHAPPRPSAPPPASGRAASPDRSASPRRHGASAKADYAPARSAARPARASPWPAASRPARTSPAKTGSSG